MDSKEQQRTAQQEATTNIDINSGEPANKNNTLSLDPASEKRIGLTKEELMEFANQPFWVRLRNILFASFWIVWLSILVIAIGYVIQSPGCAVKVVSAANTTSQAATIISSTTLAPSS